MPRHQLGYEIRDFLGARTAAEKVRILQALATGRAREDCPRVEYKVDLQPHSKTVAALLDDVAAFLRRYVVLTPEQADTLALWVAHTHAFDAARATPYIQITSAQPGSGKTILLETLEFLVARPWRPFDVTPAALFRRVHSERPTLLFDEYDATFGRGRSSEPLRAMLDAGNRRGATVSRTQYAQTRDFNVFCPKALAGLKSLPATIADRAITIRMKRKAPGEHVQDFDSLEVEEAALPLFPLLTGLGSSRRHVAELWSARPTYPEGLDNRAADSWRPLLAIADWAGQDWPRRAQRAVRTLSLSEEVVSVSLEIELLTDIRRAFDVKGASCLRTSVLIDALTAMEETPWGDLDGKPITDRRLATMLKEFEIHSKDIRFDEGTRKGYERAQFEDAWNRYLSPAEEDDSGRHRQLRAETAPESRLRRFQRKLGL